MIYKRLGEILIAAEYITPEQLNKALEIQKKVPGKKIGEILVEQGFTTQRRVYKALERQLGVDFIDLNGMALSKEMARIVPRSIARKYNVVPVEATQDTLTVYGTGYRGGTVNAANDHRIAMAAAVAATVCEEPVCVLGAECVQKSYPAFWDEFKRLGGKI